jgi:hypothetical protein
MAPELVPASKEHIEAFYQDNKTRRAYAAILDGKPVGIGGLVYEANGSVYVFSKMTDELRPYRKFILRCARKAAEMARDCAACALADPNEKNSRRLLEKVGFQHIGAIEQGEIYAWLKQPLS